MRKQWIGACLLLAGAVANSPSNRALAQTSAPETWVSSGGPSLNAPAPIGAQQPPSTPDASVITARGQTSEGPNSWGYSGTPSINAPVPIGTQQPGGEGIYGAAEFLFYHEDRTLGTQPVAARGVRDSDGSITGTPGQFIGSGRTAMTTDNFGRTSWTPGWRATIGYKLEDGSSISLSYANMIEVKYNFSVGPIPPGFQTYTGGIDTFLSSPVFGFSPQFSGPQSKASIGSASALYGLWNGATTMSEDFIQRFVASDITYRQNVYETENTRSYAMAGGRFAWFWDEYKWNTTDTESNGSIGPQDQVNYHNIMSQRMYGPFVGVGNEVFIGNAFAASADLSGAALLDVIKERAAYTLGDGSITSKRARSDYAVVPNVDLTVNVWWYPIEGMQVKLGYDLYTFWNTQYMQQPIGFNAGGPDPSYKTEVFRMIHGIHVGVGYIF
jgi:hypothetical protein